MRIYNFVYMNILLSSESEWIRHIPDIIRTLDGRKILCLEGDLGAGKTTFTKSFLKYLDSSDTVQSPTFSLINVYSYIDQGITKELYHIDLYRLKDIEDAIEIGMEEIIDSGSLCIIEWPQVIYPMLDEKFALLKIDVLENNLRSVTFN